MGRRSPRGALVGVPPDPAHHETLLVLPNAQRVRLRPLRPHEAGAVRDLYSRLSPRTRYERFFSPMPELPDSVLRLLLDVDDKSRLALVAHRDEHPGDLIALGSFGAIDACSAEVSLVVRDDWQRQRLGSEMAARILEAADARGFRRFVTHVLWGNDAIRRILKNVGVVLSWSSSGGVMECVFARRARPDGCSPLA